MNFYFSPSTSFCILFAVISVNVTGNVTAKNENSAELSSDSNAEIGKSSESHKIPNLNEAASKDEDDGDRKPADYPLDETEFQCKTDGETENTDGVGGENENETSGCSAKHINFTKYEAAGSDHRTITYRVEIYCDDCDEPFDFVKTYEKHVMRFHRKKKIFPCNELNCGESFTLLHNLFNHQFRAHGLRFKKVGGINYPPYKKVQKMKKVVTCHLCRDTFSRVAAFETHYAKAHDLAGKLYNCGQCGKSITKMTNLRRHMKTEHHKPRYSCPHCCKQLKRLDNLMMHEERCAIRRREMDGYRCEDCNKMFDMKSRAAYVRHLNHHKRHVSCPVCGSGFSLFLGWQRLEAHFQTFHADVSADGIDFHGLFDAKRKDVAKRVTRIP